MLKTTTRRRPDVRIVSPLRRVATAAAGVKFDADGIRVMLQEPAVAAGGVAQGVVGMAGDPTLGCEASTVRLLLADGGDHRGTGLSRGQ
jgi:hypothetical protein